MKLISIIILVLIVAVGWFIVVPMVAPGVTEKTVVRDAQVTLGDTCALMNQSELALTMYEGALNANATDPVLLKKKGAMLIKCGRADEAQAIYQQVLSQNANDTVALVKTGDSMVKQGKLNEAITYYDAALAITPRDASTLMKKGDAYLVMSVADTQNLKVGSITDSGTSAGTQAPSSVQQMETMQSYQNAMTAYQKAMEIDPKLSLMISTRVMGATQTQVSNYQDILNNINK